MNEFLSRLSGGADVARLLVGCYLVALATILVIIGLLMAYYFPAWSPLDALK